jgi:hypothetical protein
VYCAVGYKDNGLKNSKGSEYKVYKRTRKIEEGMQLLPPVEEYPTRGELYHLVIKGFPKSIPDADKVTARYGHGLCHSKPQLSML